MQPDRSLWSGWAQKLQRWRMQNLAIYLGQPFLKGVMPSNHMQALADLLEDRDASRQFAVFLREGK
jgi:hypothetical protein